MSDFHDRLLASFTEHQEALTRFLARRLGNPELARDLTQETWLRAATVTGVERIENPRSYLFRIASNLAHDHSRHVRHRIEIAGLDQALDFFSDTRPTPEHEAIGRSELARLLRAVDSLTPRSREVFLLAKVQELGYQEIAERLGISKNTVMSHLAHALDQLDTLFDPEFGTGDS